MTHPPIIEATKRLLSKDEVDVNCELVSPLVLIQVHVKPVSHIYPFPQSELVEHSTSLTCAETKLNVSRNINIIIVIFEFNIQQYCGIHLYIYFYNIVDEEDT